jgi:UDP-N-acetylmuramoylalanine--D-glutamate ligase
MKIAILGYGKQGASAAKYWSKDKSNSITICDENENAKIPAKYDKKLGKDYLKDLDKFSLIVRSPSVHPKQIAKANSPETLFDVTTNTNEFFKTCPSKNIIGITGTKGKGTASTLITKILQAAGKTVHLGGNIGTPPLELLENGIKKDDFVVLELANFQLIDLKYSPHIALCLMIANEHLDWHGDSVEYVNSKKQLFVHQKPKDIAVYYAQNLSSQEIAASGSGKKIPYYSPPGAIIENDDIVIDNQSICSTDEIKLLGQHNWQNVCAAVTVAWQITQDVKAIRSAIIDFGGLQHRLEFVRKLAGVKYYDDSFGTTPETAIVAIEAFKEPKIVILGGSDKGASFDELAKTVASSNVKKAVLIGDTADKIKKSLKEAGFTNCVDGGKTMKEIVKSAKDQAKTGNVVLLSTACASFGMFENYEDRGKQFKKAVKALV